MTLHFSRDLTEKPRNGPSSIGNGTGGCDDNVGLYFLAIFLKYVLGFSVVGQTNFNLTGSVMTISTGTGAAINLGTGSEFAVSIPSIQYAFSNVDMGRLIVLKSTINPMKNSGIFRIISLDTVQNIAYIDYGTSSFPPAEASLPWVICESDSVIPVPLNGPNANIGGYRSNGTSTSTRIILQSPHSSGWQVRLCRESSADTANNLPNNTVAPGFGGDANGDFQFGGQHLHHFLYHNASNTLYRQTTVGLDMNAQGWQSRLYIWGDDVTGSIVMVTRGAGGVGVPGQSGNRTSILTFGLTEDETLPLPSLDVQRLFVLGTTVAANTLEGVNFTSDFGTTAQGGSGFGLGNSPISACFSSYARLTGQSSLNTRPKDFVTAGDNSMTQRTELQTVDVMVGTYDNYDNVLGESILRLEPRRLGTVPFVRSGWSPGDFMVSSDGTWMCLQVGVWVPWSPGFLARP